MYYLFIFLIMSMLTGIIIFIVEGDIIFSKIKNKKLFMTAYISLLFILILVYSIFFYIPQDIDQDLIPSNSFYSNKTLLTVFSNAEARGIYINRINQNSQ